MLHHERHHPHERCDECADWPPFWGDLAIRLALLEQKITTQATGLRRTITKGVKTVTESNQAHLDRATAEIRASVATAVQELKDAIAAGTQAQQLDFTALDQLATDEAAEAAADAPPAPPAG